MQWVFLSSLSGVFQSLALSLNKQGAKLTSVYTTAWASRLYASLFLLPIILLTRSYHPLNSQLLASLAFIGVFNGLTSVWLVKAVKTAPVSKTLPLLGITPALLLITTPIINRETVPLLGTLGVLILTIGIYTLHLSNHQSDLLSPFTNIAKSKGARYALAVAFTYALSGNAVRIGLDHSNPLFFAFLTSIAMLAGISLILFYQNISLGNFLRYSKLLSTIGLATAITIIFQNLALNLGPTAYVFSLKRLGILFNPIFGKLFYKEKQIKQRFLGTAIIVAGVIAITLA